MPLLSTVSRTPRRVPAVSLQRSPDLTCVQPCCAADRCSVLFYSKVKTDEMETLEDPETAAFERGMLTACVLEATKENVREMLASLAASKKEVMLILSTHGPTPAASIHGDARAPPRRTRPMPPCVGRRADGGEVREQGQPSDDWKRIHLE